MLEEMEKFGKKYDFTASFILFNLIWLMVFISHHSLRAQQLAFPGAEGWGRFSKGGRGGDVYKVTNLNDSGPGSLREGVRAFGPRTIVFEVSGTIQLESDLKIISPYITIAGQTAPGDGICLRDHQVYVYANHVIIRYMRFRLGDESNTESDAVGGRYHQNIMIDHCSASWSIDESMSFYGNDSTTVQWCLIGESLYQSVHSKGAHGYGGIWGGTNVSFHHNLLTHHSSRNPRFAGGETMTCVNVDFRNNVIYNWGFNSAYGGEGGTVNMVANYFKAGPATKTKVRNRIVNPSDANGKWYIADNYVDGYPHISADNWAGGVQCSYALDQIRADSPFPYASITAQSAEEAYNLVLDNAGAVLPARDAVDMRIIRDVRTGTATYDGRYYEIKQGFADTTVVRGIIDSQNDVGGWPELRSLPPPIDTDQDGMPDQWESDHNLDPNNDSDRNTIAFDGYTMLETYLNELTTHVPSKIEVETRAPSGFVLHGNYPNPFNPYTTFTFSIPATGRVVFKIYDITGRLVKTLLDQVRLAGNHNIQWNGLDNGQRAVSSGVYLCVMNFEKESKTIKIQLVK